MGSLRDSSTVATRRRPAGPDRWPRLVGRWARLPIRIRLTVVSALATTVLLGVLGWFLYSQFQSSVNASIDAALVARANELTMLGHRTQNRPTAPAAGDDSAAYFQVLASNGRVLQASPGFRARSLIGPGERHRALAAPIFVTRHERARYYVIRARDGDLIVAGVSLAQQQDSFITFNWELLAGAPLMIAIAAIITYLVGGKLLAPVEDMRRQAAQISTERLDARLPLPASVDEIHRLASTLNSMLDRLHDGFEREVRFVSDASHELRTPLAVLKSELEVALRLDGSREEYRLAAGSAVEETDRVIALAENLLVLARAQDGQLAINPEPIAADEILIDVAHRARTAQGTRITVRPDDAALGLMADRNWIEQALLNLVYNAQRHGGGEIALEAVATDAAVELHVLDHGPGFPASFLAHAFERFSRADVSRARGGTGLGLSIVAAIATAHGGRAQARNRPEGGADVWISIPITDAPAVGSSG
jgi:two-component system, OmpR family, sensor kinase